MIVSHKHKYLLLHCRKTAGTSLKVALGKTLGPSDVLLGAWHKLAEKGVPFNRRFLLDVASPLAVLDIARSTLSSGKLPDRRRLNKIHKKQYEARLGIKPEHAPAANVKRVYGKEWDSYFKFCFVRNPYDVAVSSWLMRKRYLKEEYPLHVFLKLIQEGRPHRFLPQSTSNWEICTIDDRVVVDFVGRFENLQSDAAAVFHQLGLPENSLPHVNSSPSRYDFRDFYSAEDRQLAAQLYEKEIDTFKYTF